jgi:hypothetical protein
VCEQQSINTNKIGTSQKAKEGGSKSGSFRGEQYKGNTLLFATEFL